jgi:hypothetical protein
MSKSIPVAKILSTFLENIEDNIQNKGSGLGVLKSIVTDAKLWKEVQDVASGKVDDLSDELYELLFDSEFASDMPYGTKKARTGDPFQWLVAKIRKVVGKNIKEAISEKNFSESLSGFVYKIPQNFAQMIIDFYISTTLDSTGQDENIDYSLEQTQVTLTKNLKNIFLKLQPNLEEFGAREGKKVSQMIEKLKQSSRLSHNVAWIDGIFNSIHDTNMMKLLSAETKTDSKAISKALDAKIGGDVKLLDNLASPSMRTLAQFVRKKMDDVRGSQMADIPGDRFQKYSEQVKSPTKTEESESVIVVKAKTKDGTTTREQKFQADEWDKAFSYFKDKLLSLPTGGKITCFGDMDGEFVNIVATKEKEEDVA